MIGFRLVQEMRQSRTATDILGNVFFRIVGAVFFLSGLIEVDILFKDVAQNVRIDLVTQFVFAVIEMPVEPLKELEDAVEYRIRNVNFDPFIVVGFVKTRIRLFLS
jgi:hypothetical protein